MNASCEHIDNYQNQEKKFQKSDFIKFECEECIKIGSGWVHLRICETCGKMLCCDSSPNQHSRKHFEAIGHPVIISAQPGENWAYCWVDDITF